MGLPPGTHVPGNGPLSFGSHRDIQRIANEYNTRYGLDAHPHDYLPVDEAKAAKIAEAYGRMPHAPNDPNVAAAYQAFKDETMAQYQHAIDNGYQFEFYPQDRDPYPNSPREAQLDLHHNKHMFVYPTESGFGNEGDADTSDHPLLERTGINWGNQPTTYNDIFRGIHDFYGHAKEGVGFRHHGEDNAYRQHAAMFSPTARPAMAAETRGQNSFVNFGPNGEHNRGAGQADTIYGEQKAGLLPDWAADPNIHRPSSG